MAEYKEIRVSCMCSAAYHSFSIPTSNLPLPTNLCSCDISRRISGTLLTSYVNVTFDTNAAKPDLSALTPYKSSDILTRYFCSTCGTHMYLEYKSDGHFEVATGTLKLDSTDGIIEWKTNMWIEDTSDGGASQFISNIEGKTLKRYLQEAGQSDEVPLDWRNPSISSKEFKEEDLVHAHCHCRGVEFWVSRPNAESRNAESAYADLLIPDRLGKSANPSNYPWWLPRDDRFLAGTCACHSCRRSLGFDVTFWSFIPIVNITLDKEGTKPFQRNPYWGTMKTYQSSPNVTRTFCGTCGANVFWDGRPSLVDISVGLYDAESGTRAENLLAWWPNRVSFEEDALNRGFIRGLEEGLKDWVERNKGEKHVAVGEFPVPT
ncbi:hypothetical protein K469DRAFT_715958 [Zopfia rhizophila CBS 207.26]|uniref:CENP-V/GFA domain-containing protein n=1 Tax=Zopfia rhizophila CBS 207.26 TaxID=1314779 RepID=A0A6A6DK01_9PEZI|nr:hypothetical protein K469DRAFT_715958 [Zopfia rhizophila CBS 207.26]